SANKYILLTAGSRPRPPLEKERPLPECRARPPAVRPAFSGPARETLLEAARRRELDVIVVWRPRRRCKREGKNLPRCAKSAPRGAMPAVQTGRLQAPSPRPSGQYEIRLEAVAGDGLAPGDRPEGAPDRWADRFLDETGRAVAQQQPDPAVVPAAGRHGG